MTELILCGRGGQGIVFLTRQLGQILTDLGRDVISSETHGMAVRGGSINSHLRIGPFLSPLIPFGNADFLISLDQGETGNNIHFLKPNGVVVENSVMAGEPGFKRIDASGIARSLGSVRLENVVILGYSSTLPGFPLSPAEIRSHLEKEPRERIRVQNLAAFDAGVQASSESS
jgi:indolepyruvate ferredoxin oxidoreductase beta subunit|uniref:Pyruvate/ketoisovalerate oxidoreductase catalytic domain-containing protein n=1 Tax=Desulfomonile tiedjei TaxID=2358 RepID=A0A7C4EVP8_9BACT